MKYVFVLFILLSVLAPLSMANAQNKVVVIPMFEETTIYVGVAKTGNNYCTQPVAGNHWALQNCVSVAADISGQDGAFTAGAQAQPRFVDNANGTVLDKLTGLIWLKDTACANDIANWPTALLLVVELNSAGTMNSNSCGDLSNKGVHQADWRLPNIKELQSLLNYGDHGAPYISDLAGNGHYLDTPVFSNLVIDSAYWSSTTYGVGVSSITNDDFYDNALRVNFGNGVVDGTGKSTGVEFGVGENVWAVRGPE